MIHSLAAPLFAHRRMLQRYASPRLTEGRLRATRDAPRKSSGLPIVWLWRADVPARSAEYGREQRRQQFDEEFRIRIGKRLQVHHLAHHLKSRDECQED